jgi:hypothetical protein
MSTSKNINRTFGKRIGGSRYDRWHAGDIIRLADLSEMTAGQKAKLVVKNNIWPKPDYDALIKDGVDKDYLYYMKLVRDSLPAKPNIGHLEDFINLITLCKEKVESVSHGMGKDAVYWVKEVGLVEGNRAVNYYFNNKTYRALQMSDANCAAKRRKQELWYTDEELKEKWFEIISLSDDRWSIVKEGEDNVLRFHNKYATYWIRGIVPPDANSNWWVLVDMRRGKAMTYNTDKAVVEEARNQLFAEMKAKKEEAKERKAASRKKTYIPPVLQHVKRVGGEDCRMGMDVVGTDFIRTYAVRGGEFGEWLSDKERQTNMNMAYDSFHDIAVALGISNKDVTFNGQLAIAFGARGHGKALAHFEPYSNVINLTKMRGAGSLAHEWIHALDWAIGSSVRENGEFGTELYSDERDEAGYSALTKIVRSFAGTEYLADAKKVETSYTGYWTDKKELLARAGAAYIKDKLTEKGIRNDYLVGHAEDHCPKGEERKMFDKLFDELILALKENHFFQERQEEVVKKMFSEPEDEPEETDVGEEKPWHQMSFFEMMSMN